MCCELHCQVLNILYTSIIVIPTSLLFLCCVIIMITASKPMHLLCVTKRCPTCHNVCCVTSVEPPDALDGVNVSKQVEAMDDEVMRKSWEDIVVMDNVDKEECQQDTPIESLDKVSSASNFPTAQNIKPSGKSISS